jgi:hypothetical protein
MGTEKLVSGANEKVTPEGSDVDELMGSEVHGIDIAQGSDPGGSLGNPGQIDQSPEGIGASSHRHQPRPLVNQGLEMIEIERRVSA